MKILRNLVVTGELLQAESGDVAAVGDSIILYLDQTYNPSFPISVQGTIDGITKVNCDSATSYDVEYDEVALEGSGVSYLRPEDVSDYLVLNQAGIIAVDLEAEAAARIEGDSTESVLAALQGEDAIPDKIGGEYMPEVIPNVILELADATGVVLPNGALARDNLNRLRMGDDVTAGGVLVTQQSRRYDGSVVITAAQSASPYLAKVREFPILASEAVAGKKLRFVGRLWGYSSGAIVSGRFGISTAQQRANTGMVAGVAAPGRLSGVNLPASADSGAIFTIDVNYTGTLTTVSTYLTLTDLAGTTPNGVSDRVVSSVVTRSAQNFANSSNTRFTTNANESLELWIGTSTSTGTDFVLHYDLQIYFE